VKPKIVHKIIILAEVRLHKVKKITDKLAIIIKIFIVFKLSMLVGLLVVLLHLVCLIIRFKNNYKNKISHFECGFPSSGYVRGRYSIQFFSILIIFILFDLELLFLIIMFYKHR
jgi:NADH:ubiquinone oxidoreductase subunit 3 (subunit A)